jgi:Flp pilus assembly pilin Flp
LCERAEEGGVAFSVAQSLRARRTDERGTVTVEYTVLLVVVALACVFAMVAAGVPLVRAYLTRETWLLFPFP